MTEMQCRELVGAYAVGALEPPEAARLADHLLTCTRCRHELGEAEETAALMAAVPPEAFIDEPADPNDPLLMRTLYAIRVEASEQTGPPPRQAADGPQLRSVRGEGSGANDRPSEGFPGWSGRTARSHRRRPRASSATQQRRNLTYAGAAAAAVLVLGGGVLLGNALSGGDDDKGTNTVPVAERTIEPTGPPSSEVGSASFGLRGTSKTTGASLDVGVASGDTGYLTLDLDGTRLPAGQDVEVLAVSSLNETVSVGIVKVSASGVLDVSKSVKMAPGDLQTIELRTSTGDTLVTATRIR